MSAYPNVLVNTGSISAPIHTQARAELLPAADLPPPTQIRPSPVHGNGIFATRDILPGQIVEKCPCIVLEDGWQRIHTILHDYLYCWPKEGDGRAIVLGHGSLFNHAQTPNIEWETDTSARQCIYHATRLIHQGEELFINYGQDYWTTENAAAAVHQRVALADLLARYQSGK